MPPGTIIAYRITLSQVVDFSVGYYAGEWDPLWEDWNCDWRRRWVREHIEPPSWLLGEMVMEASAKGLLFPSTKGPGGTNLVVFNGMLDAQDRIEVHDPLGALPQNQDSWDRAQ